jgi:UDP:flavonoid glycosyltransferase YjiC (YdhE family)
VNTPTADRRPVAGLEHLILCALGSSGDVHPFVGLGRELVRRGYRVTVLAAGYFRGLVERAGLEFVDPLPDTDFRDTIRDERIWHRLRGPRTIIDRAVRPLLEPVHRIIVARETRGATLAVGSSLAFGARVAQESHGIPLVSVHLSPALFRSDFAGPRLPGLFVDVGPPWFRQMQWRLVDALVVDPAICPWLNTFRSRFGLPPARRIWGEWMHSPLAVLGMFPDWFAPLQPDWPPGTRLTGFPLYSEEGVVEPAPADAAWVEAERPIVFTPGSANVFGHAFFAAAADACRRLGRPGLLLTRFPEQVPTALPPGVRHRDFLPFRWLLRRAAALVHHGGIGSTSQALAAGIPQLIMPLAFDQFDNAARAARLGVGTAIVPRRFTGPAVAQILDAMLADAGLRERCAALAARLTNEDGLLQTADAVEQAWLAHSSGQC